MTITVPKPSTTGFVYDERPSDSPFVERVWRNDSGSVSSFLSVAKPYWFMVFTHQYGRTHISVHGPETRATLAPCPEEAEFLGILFKVGSFMPSFPSHALVDGELELPQVSKRSFWLNGAAWDIPTFENVDTFVARLAREGLIARDEVVDSVLAGAPPRLSPRTVQRRFQRATGLTHGATHQIIRAGQAVRLLQQGTPVLDVVEQAGYFDQAHLTHALKRLIGLTPAQVAASQTPLSIF
jgi:hypothetical protein